MSPTSSDRTTTASSLLADALVTAIGRSTADRRIFMTTHLGIEPQDVFEDVLGMCGEEVSLPRLDPLLAGVVNDVQFVPYLVVPASEAGPNRGTQGFAARLRTHFSSLDTTRSTVLLVFDRRPVETVRSAAEDAAALPDLQWPSLLERAASHASTSPASTVISCVAGDLAGRPPSGALLSAFVAYAAAQWDSLEEAGSNLPDLGLYVSDPEVRRDPARLRRGYAWRSDLDQWAAPGEDLRRRLISKLGHTSPGILKVLDAVGPFGIDYSQFVLEDLKRDDANLSVPRFRRPFRIEGASAVVSSGGRVAIWAAADSPFRLSIAGNLDGSEAVRINRVGRETAEVPVDEGSVTVAPFDDGWTFAQLSVVRSGEVLDSIDTAVWVGAGNWFPVESGLAVDVDQAAFRADSTASAIAVAPGGGILGPVPLDLPEQEAEGSPARVDAVATREGSSVVIPILVDAGEDVPSGPGGPARGPGERPGDPDDPAPGPTPDEAEAASPAHALLRFVRDHGTANPTVAFQSSDPDWQLTVEGARVPLASQAIGALDGLDVEAQILQMPAAWAYTATRGSGATTIADHPLLSRLRLHGALQDAALRFAQARERFFAVLRPAGSVFALAAGTGLHEAREYVDAYKALVDCIPVEGRYQPEYDRVLLIDTVVDTTSGDRYIAPTNPVTVAFFLDFIDAARVWSRDPANIPADLDLASISPEFLLPLFQADSVWYECRACGPFLWRCFETVDEHGPAPANEATLIARRLRFFLSVHPAYDDPRQTLRVVFRDPGTGSTVVDALRAFYRNEHRKEDYERPQLELKLITQDGRIPIEVEDLLTGGEDDAPEDPVIRTRTSIAALDPQADIPFCHVTFVFNTPAQRRPEPVELASRAGTRYVGGLAVRPGRRVEYGANERSFAWGTFGAGAVGQLDPEWAPVSEHLVRRTLELVGGQPRELLKPGVTRMLTTAVGLEFMPEDYARSVWVVHLDHLIGLEAFAPEHAGTERYLIDYEDVPGAAGLGGVTATSHVAPYREAVARALSEIDELTHEGLDRILRLLNTVSGRWALQLLQDPVNRVRERIGTVAAIAMLEDIDGAFQSREGVGVVIPLEEIFDRVPEFGVERPNSRANDDLLYVHIPAVTDGEVQLHGRLMEVKYRSRGGPDLAEARQQIENTEEWLRAAFCSYGPSRIFRSRDLAEILRSSISRGRAFGLLEAGDTAPVEAALEQVAAGNFDLQFRYQIGDREAIGEVVSIELENRGVPIQATLPGAGAPAGLVRLGRSIIQSLALAERLERPSTWTPPSYGAVRIPSSDTEREAEPADAIDQPDAVPVVSELSETEAPSGATPREEETAAEVARIASELDSAVLKYGLELEPFQPDLAQVGPSVIRLRARPLGRQSLEGVARRSLDLGREVGCPEGILVAQEPYFITVDVPRGNRQVVTFGDHVEQLAPTAPGSLDFLVGVAPSGEVRTADLARLPHLLIAGATGSGKSVFVRCVLTSLLMTNLPEELQILLVDPKQVDFMAFEDLPHLLDRRIIFDPSEAVQVLAQTIEHELEKRRPILKAAGVASATEFYEQGGSRAELPQLVVVVDEFADLAGTLGRSDRAEFMSLVQRYGQLTRAFGIYLVLATQRPSVQVITGDIKANLTARIALKVQAYQDSMTILGHRGAESLRDRGDLIFEHGGGAERLQGFFVTPTDVRSAVSKWTGTVAR